MDHLFSAAINSMSRNNPKLVEEPSDQKTSLSLSRLPFGTILAFTERFILRLLIACDPIISASGGIYFALTGAYAPRFFYLSNLVLNTAFLSSLDSWLVKDSLQHSFNLPLASI